MPPTALTEFEMQRAYRGSSGNIRQTRDRVDPGVFVRWASVPSMLALAFLALGNVPLLAQNPSSARPQGGTEVIDPPFPTIEHRSMKPSIPKRSVKPNESKGSESLDTAAVPSGVTFVAHEAIMERIFRGDEPKNQRELQALQRQQTKVAEKLSLVTVNLQHGSTQGSGVIITGGGYVLTAAHVAGKPNHPITIVLGDGRRINGTTMGVNRNMDAGLVRMDSKVDPKTNEPWPHASIGQSSEIEPGQWCIAAGHPGGWMSDRPAVVRVGRILRKLQSTIFTDCSLIGGDSGGPLFDLNGNLIAIHSRIGVDVDDNMHVPIDVFADSWKRLLKKEAWGTLPGYKPVIGVRGASNPKPNSRCEISEVTKNGPAANAGIRPGDIIVKFDGESIQVFDDLINAVNNVVPGERVTVEIERDGNLIQLRLVVGVGEP